MATNKLVPNMDIKELERQEYRLVRVHTSMGINRQPYLWIMLYNSKDTNFKLWADCNVNALREFVAEAEPKSKTVPDFSPLSKYFP